MIRCERRARLQPWNRGAPQNRRRWELCSATSPTAYSNFAGEPLSHIGAAGKRDPVGQAGGPGFSGGMGGFSGDMGGGGMGGAGMGGGGDASGGMGGGRGGGSKVNMQAAMSMIPKPISFPPLEGGVQAIRPSQVMPPGDNTSIAQQIMQFLQG